MARIESDREDLMREATALRRRVEFVIRGEPVVIVAGFRDDGSLSVYFDAEMLQFDSANRLRRAFYDGRLYRTQGDSLARLKRFRSADESSLQRHDLTSAELASFLETIAARIQSLDVALQEQQVQVKRSIPDRIEVLGEVAERVASIAAGPIALAPPINARR
ncbi:MAG: hypothetical protein AB7O26_03610 [Planctomycetaceae bacterium]